MVLYLLNRVNKIIITQKSDEKTRLFVNNPAPQITNIKHRYYIKSIASC
jgi:hypothetical protein